MKDPFQSIGRLRITALFEGLSSDQLNKLLLISMRKNYDKNEVLFNIGEEPEEMFLLISGKLRVIFADGGESPVFTPNGMVGFVGIFTGAERSISVVSSMISTVLAFHRDELIRLFGDDPEMYMTIQSNVIRYLSEKFDKTIALFEETRCGGQLEIS